MDNIDKLYQLYDTLNEAKDDIGKVNAHHLKELPS